MKKSREKLLLAVLYLFCVFSPVFAGSYSDVFSFTTVNDARSAWDSTQEDDSYINIGTDPVFGNYLAVSVLDSYGGCTRNVDWDLSGTDVISFMMHISEHGMVGVLGFQFRSGPGWYVVNMEVHGEQRKTAGWKRVILPKSIFRESDSPTGWDSISCFRVVVWPDDDFPESPDILIKLVDFHRDSFSEVGNLVQNSSFEYASTGNIPDGWGNGTFGMGGTGTGKWTEDMDTWHDYWLRTDADSYNGSYCMRLENGTISDDYPAVQLAGVWISPTDASMTHTFSAYMKSVSGTASIEMTMGECSSTVTVGTGWNRYSISGSPNWTERVVPRIKLLTDNAVVYIDAVQLENNTSATTYLPFDSDYGTAEEATSLTPDSLPTREAITVSSKPAITSTNISIDASGRFLVNGQPFIPYAYGTTAIPTDDTIELIAESGFNTICLKLLSTLTASEITDFCDKCASEGLYTILRFHATVSDSLMTTWINSLKTHPAVLAWNVLDEPSDPSDPSVQARINAAHTADSSHPAYVNYIKGKYNSGNLPGDIASIDDYVIPWSCPLRNGLAAKVMVDAVASAGKPAWAWLQGTGGFAWLDRNPTPLENTCMLYLNLIYGVRGIKYYVGIPCSDVLWEDMCKAGTEVEYLNDILYDTTTPPDMEVNDTSIHYTVKEHDGDTYVIAVNSSLDTIQAVFTGLCIIGKNVSVLFEDRSITADNDNLNDAFGPYERHVYKLSAPVTETIVFQNGTDINGVTYMGTQDAMTNQATPDTPKGANYWPLDVRTDGRATPSIECTALFKFADIDDHLPTGFVVKTARIGLTAYETVQYPMTVQVSEMLKTWNNALLTWNVDGLGSNWAAGGGMGAVANGQIPADRSSVSMSSVDLTTSVQAGDTVWFDIDSELVQSWIDNPGTNYGVIFFSRDGTTARKFRIVGRTGAGDYTPQRPKLEITGAVTPAVSIEFQNGQDIGNETYAGTQDAMTNQATPDTPKGANYWPLDVRSDGRTTPSIECTALFKFADIDDYIPTDFVVDSARIGLTAYETVQYPMTVELSEMLKSWNNALLTWNVDGLGSNWAAGGGMGTVANGQIPADRSSVLMSSVDLTTSVHAGDTVWFDLGPELVQDWLDNPNTNYGVILFSRDGTIAYKFRIVGRSAPVATHLEQRPKLEINGHVFTPSP